MLKLISTAYARYGEIEPLPPGYCETIDWNNPELRALVCIFNRVYNALILSVGAVFIIWMIISGIRYMSAGGDEKAVAAARRSLTFAVLGFILVLFAYTIIALLDKLLGAGLNLPIFTIPEPAR